MIKGIRTSLFMLAASGLLFVGCYEGENGKKTSHVGVQRAALTKAVDCDSLEQMIKADALAKMNAHIDAEIWSWGQWGEFSASDMDSNASPPSNHAGGREESSQGSDKQEKASEYTDTNTQVEGIDEADIVKTDGKNIYLLHGEEFLVLNAWPSSELEQLSSFSIEGTPSEMFVTDEGKVVVYSTVAGDPIYTAAGLERRSAYDDSYSGYGDSAEPYYPGYIKDPLTKITVLQLTNNEPSVVKEMYFEGSYISSRREGKHVRTVIGGASFGPTLQYWLDDYPSKKSQAIAAYERLRQKNKAIIEASTLSDWLPYSMVRTESGVEAALAQCDEFYVPTAATTTYGMTQIQSIDLDHPEAMPQGASIVGATDTVYSSFDTFVLAARAWVDPMVYQEAAATMWGDTPVASEGGGTASRTGQDSVGTSRSPLTEPISYSYTHLHTFDLVTTPNQPRYIASGTVPGTVLNQFSLDVHQGHLRIATTDDRISNNWNTNRVNHVFVLAPQGDELVVTGSIRDLAPGERIYSARFMGEKGYLVTFRQVDPLFVLDLADPAEPKVLGELKIPGFSEYMHPLGENHLLTIGQDDGLALQIFDVSDPLNPTQKHKFVYSAQDIYGYSEAQSNHKAFTYYASRGLLAFPFEGWNYNNGTYRSSLEVFDIDVDAGIQQRGSIEHSNLFGSMGENGYCRGYYGSSVRRGLFLEDFVYSVSYGGVVVNHIDDLATVVASLELVSPKNSSYDCY